jgi:hypothetical protein
MAWSLKIDSTTIEQFYQIVFVMLEMCREMSGCFEARPWNISAFLENHAELSF